MASDQTRLGVTLRAWRDRLTPAAVGFPVGGPRRAAGLRREELADLSGISVDYLVRLEQGRATTPSEQVVAALARALQLNGEERDHLYRLAGLRPPQDGMIVDHMSPGMQRVLMRLGETPISVFSADWRLIWWNQSWPVISEMVEETDRAIVADLRRAAGRYPNDPRLTTLIERRLAGNEHFAALWHEATVAGHRADRKVIRHPEIGDITVECDVLNDSDTDIKLVIYTAAPGSEDETKLQLARVIGAHATTPA
jgi:transcriptional regulator with XRE-family HTH domain